MIDSDDVLALIRRRKEIYLRKANNADPAIEPSETPWDRYQFGVEAMEWIEAEVRALVTTSATTDGSEPPQ